jgi:hypothetical protein
MVTALHQAGLFFMGIQAMQSYTVKAYKPGTQSVDKQFSFKAKDQFEATMHAIECIIRAAFANPNSVYAKGRIELVGPDGKVIREMPAKE